MKKIILFFFIAPCFVFATDESRTSTRYIKNNGEFGSKVNGTMFNSNSSYTTTVNMIGGVGLHSRGEYSQKFGNMTIHSDQYAYSMRIGNTFYHSNGAYDIKNESFIKNSLGTYDAFVHNIDGSYTILRK